MSDSDLSYLIPEPETKLCGFWNAEICTRMKRAVTAVLLVRALWGACTWWLPQLLTCSHVPLTSTFSPGQLLLWKFTAVQGMTWSPSSLICLIWLDTNCNMPWFGELPLAKLSPLRSPTHRPWFMNTRLSVLGDFLYWNMQCQLSSKR